jgi:hypothetical protein
VAQEPEKVLLMMADMFGHLETLMATGDRKIDKVAAEACGDAVKALKTKE